MVAVVDVTKASFVTDAGPIKPFQAGTFPGELVITASRTSGVSPCGIVFSAKNTTRNSYDSHQILGIHDTKQVGYYWDFGDPNSGTFNTYHSTSKNTSVGGYMAAHVFEVADGGGAAAFIVSCRAKDSDGNEAWAAISVTVQAQDSAYSGANTIAISNTKSAGNWDSEGDTRNPPSGYDEHATIASAFTSLNMDDCAGKRIMLYRGDDFSAEGAELKILSGNNNFHITWFGPELSGTVITEGSSTISFAAPFDGWNVYFDAGTTAFVATETVTGGTSGETADVLAVVLTSGSWAGNDAAGYLEVENATGLFSDNEALTGDGSGAATADGASEATEIDKNNGIGGTITDTNSGLGSLTVGAEIDITGAAGNNATWTVRSVAAGSVTVRYNRGTVMTTETANGNAVITEHTLRPEIPGVLVGVNASGVTSTDQSDTTLSNNGTTFSNSGYCENVYIDGVRAHKIELQQGILNATIHRADLDFEDAAATGRDTGRVDFGNGLWSWNQPAILDPDNARYTRGVVVSETVCIGSTAEILANGDPTTLFKATNNGHPTWTAVIGSSFRSSDEMNVRLQGYENFTIQDCDLLGQSIGVGAGGKGRLVQRAAGANHVDEITTLTRRGDFASDNTDPLLYPVSRWSVVQYIFDSASSEGASTYSEIGNAVSVELNEDVLWTHYVVDSAATQRPNSIQVAIQSGRYICVTGVTGLVNSGIFDDNSGEILDDGPNNVVTNGVKSTQEGYLGPLYLATTASPSLHNLPVPSAPR